MIFSDNQILPRDVSLDQLLLDIVNDSTRGRWHPSLVEIGDCLSTSERFYIRALINLKINIRARLVRRRGFLFFGFLLFFVKIFFVDLDEITKE